MRAKTLLSFGLLASQMLWASAASAMAPDKFYARTSPSVWRVVTYDADGIVFRQGSAVVVGKETLLTNCHVLAKAKRFAVKQDNATYEGKLQHVDVERDLCQISVRNLPAPAAPLGDSDKIAVGQKVYTLGNPKGLELTLSDGLVSALRKGEDGKLMLIQTSAPFSQGSSGGGLFDEDGRLIGITTLIARDAQNLNFAVPINWLRDLPARSEAALAKRRNGGVTPVSVKTDKEASEFFGGEEGKSSDGKPGAAKAAAFADLNDIARIPFIGEKGRAKYAEFLTKPSPRAFAISEKGGWWASWGNNPADPNAPRDPAARAVRDCEKSSQQRCFLYAVNDAVVYQPGQQ